MQTDKNLFLGLKQVTSTYFSGLDDSEKLGYLWFVRYENPIHFEMYLGSRKYGETGELLEAQIDEICGEIENIINSVTELFSKITTIEENEDIIFNRISDLSGKTEELSSEIVDITNDVSNLNNDLVSLSGVVQTINVNTPLVDLTEDTGNTFAIDANKMYMFGERTTLTITLKPEEENIVNEYMFQFTSGSVATTLNIPTSIVWLKDPDIQTNKKYAVSIENNLGVIGEWSNE